MPILANGTDLITLGVPALELPDRLFAPSRNFPTVGIPGRLGSLRSGPARYDEAIRTARAYLRPDAGTVAARVAAEQDLEDLLYGTVVLRADDGVLAKETLVTTTRLEFTPQGGRLQAPAAAMAWSFRLEEASWRSVLQTFGLPAGVRVPFPVGTAPSEFEIRVFGSTSNPFTLTFRRHTGEVIATLTFPFALSSTETMYVSGANQTCLRSVAGGALTAAAFTGDFPAVGFAPADANRGAGLFGSVELSSGSGDVTGSQRFLT